MAAGRALRRSWLARRGCRVVGVAPSPDLLLRLAADARGAGVDIETHLGRIEHLATVLGMRGRWQVALDAFDGQTYVNELGVHARAQRLDDVTSIVSTLGLIVEAWYGVRVFTDPMAGDRQVDGTELDLLLRAEYEAGRRDPYRQVAAQIHLIARSGELSSVAPA